MSGPLRVLIADDEPLVREGVRELLHDEHDFLIVAEAGDGVETIDRIAQHQPDVLFLDVQMPEVDGFGVVAALDEDCTPAIVFVTAYDEYAVRAFEVHAVDYLLKPFDAARFRTALARVRARLAGLAVPTAAVMHGSLHRVLEELQAPLVRAERFLVKHRGHIVVVLADELDWVEAADNYVRLHSRHGTYLMRQTIRTLEQRLDPRTFQRVHRSAIVNIGQVRELHPMASGEFSLVLVCGQRLPLGRRYRRAFLQRFTGES